MPRKKKRAVRGTTRAGTARANAPSRYAWHRRVPWVAVGAAAVILVVGFLLARSLFGIGGGPGRFTGPGGGIGDHRTPGMIEQIVPVPDRVLIDRPVAQAARAANRCDKILLDTTVQLHGHAP